MKKFPLKTHRVPERKPASEPNPVPESLPAAQPRVPDASVPNPAASNLYILRPLLRNYLAGYARPEIRCRTNTGYPLIYVCSPYRAETDDEIKRNVKNALMYSEYVISEACVPLAPHLLYPRFLNDAVENDRTIGMICAHTLLCRCDELWVFGENGISEGMMQEIFEAQRMGMQIRWFGEDLKQVTPDDLGL